MALLHPACASSAKLTEPLLMAVLVVVWAAPATGAALALDDDAVLVAARFGAMLHLPAAVATRACSDIEACAKQLALSRPATGMQLVWMCRDGEAEATGSLLYDVCAA